MKYTWHPDDINPGIWVCKHFSYQGREQFEPCGNSIKWTRLIGFQIGNERVKDCYNLISLADGMIFKAKSKQELCDSFNADELIPMPFDWLVKSIELNMKGYYRV